MSTFEMDTGEAAGCRPTDLVDVATLTADDLAAIVRIDAAAVGRPRRAFLEQRLQSALNDGGIRLALAATFVAQRPVEGLVGFLLGSIHYGEFGLCEPTATIEVVGVDPEARGHHVAAALLAQAEMQLLALGIETLRTEVSWDEFELLGFFRRSGFAPAPRLCLEKTIGD